MIRIPLRAGALLLALAVCQTASAHFLWVVADTDAKPAKVRVYFAEAAEPDDPALLSKVQKAEAWVLGSGGRRAEPKSLTLKQAEGALEADLDAVPAAVILRHTYGVLEKGGETFLLKYYAKSYPTVLPGTWTAVRDEERLPLEITPRQVAEGLSLKVTWKGEPVRDVAVTVSGPGLEKTELKTDEGGLCAVKPNQHGLFSIRARHVETAKGDFEGKTYASVRHYSTLSLRYLPVRLSPSSVSLPPLPKPTTSFGGAILGDRLYVYGGNYGSAHDYANEDQSGDLWTLDLKNPVKWEQQSGGQKLQGLAMVGYQGKLYRVGGFTALNKGSEPQNLRSQADFASYDPRTAAWAALPSLPEPRSSHDAAVIGDTLYVVGGWSLNGESRGSKWHETALSCNLADAKSEWKPIAAPPFKRRALTLAAHQGKLYCLGGMQEQGGTTTAVAIYDPAANSWSEGPGLLGTGMDGFGASAFGCGGELYVTTMSGSIQRLAGKQWEFLGQLNHPRFFHRLLPWQDEKLVVVGGASMTVGKIEPLEVLPVSTVKTAAK